MLQAVNIFLNLVPIFKDISYSTHICVKFEKHFLQPLIQVINNNVEEHWIQELPCGTQAYYLLLAKWRGLGKSQPGDLNQAR